MRFLRVLRYRQRSLRTALAVGLLLAAYAARSQLPGQAAYIRRQLLGADRLERVVSAFTEAVSGSDSLGEAVSVFREALDGGR